MVHRRILLKGAGALLVSIAPRISARAQEASWPSRTIKLIVGFAPGGTADILARKLAASLSSRLGQTMIVENRAGASGMTATLDVARSPADGYELELVVSTHASLAAINKKLPYDADRDFAPVVFVGSIPLVLIVGQKSPFATLPALLAAAKAKPGSLNYAFPGIGLSHQFAGELLKQRGGVDIQGIAYRGTGPALTDVISGAVDMTFATLPAVMGSIGGGVVRALAITAPQRAESLPNVPTFAELGFPGFDVSEWFGIVAPAKTPPAIVARLNAETNAVLADPDLQLWLKQNSVVRGTITPDGFRRFIAAEITKLSAIAAKAGITAN
jgi:tripartite-type tricarboxylate transporter receptor subunit TctC